MAQIQKKFLAANAVDGTKLRLSNNENLRARNAANSADIDVLKVNASDRIEFTSVPQSTSDALVANDLVRLSQLTAVSDEVDDLVSLSGVAAGSTDLGTFTGATIPDGSTVKDALQSLETAIESLPDPLVYIGTWNASTNTPTLDNTDTGAAGHLYQVTVAGSVDFGAGGISFEVGDKVVNNGTIWEKWDMTDAVSSVNGQTGAVTLALDDLNDVDAASPNDGDALTYDSGSGTWVNTPAAATLTGGDMITVSTGVISVDLASVSGLESSNPGNVTGQLRIKLEASNPSLQIDGSNQLGIKLNAAGAVSSGASGLTVRADAATVKINASNNLESLKQLEENLTLSGTDITNQYVDLAHAAYGASASVNSVKVSVVGGPLQQKTVDYTVSLTGGAGGVTRISFAGDLATAGNAALVATDVVSISYDYLT